MCKNAATRQGFYTARIKKRRFRYASATSAAAALQREIKDLLSGHNDLLRAGSVDWPAHEIHRCRRPVILSKMSQRLGHRAIVLIAYPQIHQIDGRQMVA
jgi:hypothetical protein